MMMISGIADEAGKDLATQIKAHAELDWKYIEIRTVEGKQFSELSNEEFTTLKADLDAANIQVSAIGSQIANWATKITDPFEPSAEVLEILIPRMKALGVKYVRVMSWPNDGLADDAWLAEATKRMKALVSIAEKADIILGLENCDGYASQSADHYVRFIEAVDSPNFKALYDTGNPAGHGFETWEWYTKTKPHIGYVHIKARAGKTDDSKWCFPDDSEESKVAATLADLYASGYTGIISIEPHMASVIHLAEDISDEEKAYQTYVEYGRRTTRMVAEAAAGKATV